MSLKLKKTIKKFFPWLLPLCIFCINRVYGIFGLLTLLRQRHLYKCSSADKKVVAFMCQYIPAWSKQKNIYEAMLNDPHFEPLLICIPSDITKKCNHNDNDTYKYYVENNYKNVINALDSNDDWVSLKELGVTHAFYSRPYNHFMPKPYRASMVSRYAKVCVVMYAYLLSSKLANVLFHKNFFAYVSVYFAESEYTKKHFINHNKIGYKLGLQKVFFEGVHGLEELYDAKNKSSASWEFSQNNFRVIWTPRWTTDKELGGGSSFLPFSELMMKLAQDNKDIDILIRPHPLMFDNFIKTGEMTEDEVTRYKKRCELAANVNLDAEKEYMSTFWQSDVLVSDLSSIMPEYLAIGKPIIYIDFGNDNVFTPEMSAMVEVCYVVRDFDELRERLICLKNGNDVLADKRKSVAETYFKLEQSITLGNRIVEILRNN